MFAAQKVQTKNSADPVAIIGGGPAGSFSAFCLAKHGVNVTVFEEHPVVGVPSHCAGHIGIRSLRSLGLYPLPDGILENEFSTANFYSPNGTKFAVHLNQPVTCAVNRALFDAYLAKKAQAAGATYHLGSRVQSLCLEDGFVKGVNVTQGVGGVERFSANLVIDAEGVSSRFVRQAGLQPLKGEGLVYAVEAEVENVQGVEANTVEVYTGKAYAPGFYGWLIPRLDGTAKVGLATNHGNPKTFIDRLMREHPVASKALKNAKITHMAFHAITLGGPVAKAYGNGFLVVGDAASQVKSTTGGGVVFSVTCAKVAAEVAHAAIQQNDFSEKFLELYQKRCAERLGFDSAVMLRARRIIDSFSDQNIDRGLRFCARVGLNKALRDIDEIDFQGHTLFTVLKKPAAYVTLAYFLRLYLSANA
jgi:digeranylgeranylglycerophospholipid reductase